jgi:hypothetical protein
MSKMITNLITSVLYDADEKLTALKKGRYKRLSEDLEKTYNLDLTSSAITSELDELRRICALQKTLRQWYVGAPYSMEVVPPNTIEALQRLFDAVTLEHLDIAVYGVIDEVLEKCPNWTYGTPPVEAEVLPPSEVDATADADIPHTTDTGEDA